jgi:hypothetical protein
MLIHHHLVGLRYLTPLLPTNACLARKEGAARLELVGPVGEPGNSRPSLNRNAEIHTLPYTTLLDFES